MRSRENSRKPVIWDLFCKIRNRVADADGRMFDTHTIAQQRTFEVVLACAPKGILLKDLARIRGVTAGTASVAVSALERIGMARREAVDGDRRATLILPTAKALRKAAALDALTEKVTERALDGVPAADREVCFRVLEKMRENLELQN